MALTGTPLQNNLMEYHVMVSLVRGPVLGSSAEFKKRFQDPIDNGLMVDSEPRDVKRMKRRLFVLNKEIKDFVLRRDETLLRANARARPSTLSWPSYNLYNDGCTKGILGSPNRRPSRRTWLYLD